MEKAINRWNLVGLFQNGLSTHSVLEDGSPRVPLIKPNPRKHGRFHSANKLQHFLLEYLIAILPFIQFQQNNN